MVNVGLVQRRRVESLERALLESRAKFKVGDRVVYDSRWGRSYAIGLRLVVESVVLDHTCAQGHWSRCYDADRLRYVAVAWQGDRAIHRGTFRGEELLPDLLPV